MLKALIKSYKPLYNKLVFIRTINFSVWMVNVLFQKILRKGAHLDFNVHFTSTIDSSDLKFHYDKVTLISFAASGQCYFQSFNGIYLGKNFLFASGVKLISSNHDFKNRDKSLKGNPIVIGDNVWVGTNAIILPEVEIGDNCIIGAGAVVTKSFREEGLIIAGNPARVIGKVDEKD